MLLLLLLQAAGADSLRIAPVTVKEGTQRDELILDLTSGIELTTGETSLSKQLKNPKAKNLLICREIHYTQMTKTAVSLKSSIMNTILMVAFRWL